MSLIDIATNENTLTVYLQGHIDSANAQAVEEEITQAREAAAPSKIVLDCSELEYISSAGLRIILRLKKAVDDTSLVEVSSDVYEILEVTGFTEMLEVHKAYRSVSIEGCEVIGQGANGKVYRIDPDTIVKVYFNPEALPEIHRERELARTAFVLGIPTAIPYDVVRVGDGYGSVFELLNAKSFAKLIISGEKTLDEVVEMSVELLKQIHATEVDPTSMPDMREVALDWAAFMKDYLEPELAEKLYSLVEAVPQTNNMLHGDYHIKNVMLQNGEVLLIDMDTLCHGHPIFELASVYNAYCGYSETNHANTEAFLGITHETAVEFWDKFIHLYLEGENEEKVQEVSEKAQIVGYTRMMRRSIRRDGLNRPEGIVEIENCKAHLEELIPKYDTLTF